MHESTPGVHISPLALAWPLLRVTFNIASGNISLHLQWRRSSAGLLLPRRARRLVAAARVRPCRDKPQFHRSPLSHSRDILAPKLEICSMAVRTCGFLLAGLELQPSSSQCHPRLPCEEGHPCQVVATATSPSPAPSPAHAPATATSSPYASPASLSHTPPSRAPAPTRPHSAALLPSRGRPLPCPVLRPARSRPHRAVAPPTRPHRAPARGLAPVPSLPLSVGREPCLVVHPAYRLSARPSLRVRAGQARSRGGLCPAGRRVAGRRGG